MKKWFSQNWLIVLSGLVIGAAAVTLTALGNPGNMGFCIACFLRDTSGALGPAQCRRGRPVYPSGDRRHRARAALIAAVAAKEFKGRGGSSPVLRFVLGVFVMIGALMFLGCPLRMVIRLRRRRPECAGRSRRLYRRHPGRHRVPQEGLQPAALLSPDAALEGAAFPLVLVGLCVVYLLLSDGLQGFSEEGPGSMHAAIGVALVVGRDRWHALPAKPYVHGRRHPQQLSCSSDFGLISGFLAILIAVIIGNLILGNFNLGFEGQPVAHTDGLWNFLGMALVGWGSVLLGGCPLRQLVLGRRRQFRRCHGRSRHAGRRCRSAITLGLASSADGPTANGKVAVIIGFVVALLVSLVCTRRAKE